MTTFNELGLSTSVLHNIARLGLHTPSAIQAACIPAILSHKDVIGIAKTGSGKTATFALPIVHKLLEDPFGIFALCLSPTRELAHQIAEQFMVFSAGTNLRCDVIIGGEDLIMLLKPCDPDRTHIHLSFEVISQPVSGYRFDCGRIVMSF